MVESEKHKILVQKAKDYLLSLGIDENDIFLEYKIEIDERSYTGRGYYADIVGIKDKKLIIIECGRTNPEKIEFLRSKGEVYILPYGEEYTKPIKLENDIGFSGEERCKAYCISLIPSHINFIRNQRRTFCLSKFVRAKLEEYIKVITEYKQFVENEEKI